MTTEIAALEVNSLSPANSYSRRAFIVTSLGAGFALGVQPVMAQTVISTPADGLAAGEIRVPAQGGEMVAYRAMPGGLRGPCGPCRPCPYRSCRCAPFPGTIHLR